MTSTPTNRPSAPTAPTGDPFAAVVHLPGVDDAVARVRAVVDDLRGQRMLRRRSAEVSAESALRGARASAALEGAEVPLDVLRRTLKAGGVLPDAEAPVVEGALRVTSEVGALASTLSRAPLQALARWHVLAASDVVPAEELGRPRDGAAVRLRPVVAAVTARTSAPALVVSAIVHAELLVVAPFDWGTGLVARAAARAVLIDRGLDPKALAVPESGHLELGVDGYDAALDGYREGTARGVAAWIVHCADALALGAREGIAIATALERG
jgi:hypothetical protein